MAEKNADFHMTSGSESPDLHQYPIQANETSKTEVSTPAIAQDTLPMYSLLTIFVPGPPRL